MLISILLKKRNHRVSQCALIFSFLILLFSSTPYISGQFIKPIESSFQTFNKQENHLDYIVVLGCGHTTNESIPALTQLQSCSLQRLTEALRIFQLHPEATIITSGYAGSDIETNAIKVKQAAISLGVPQEKIITYTQPKDTEEEAKLISPLLLNKSFALVTNASHMPRAIKYFSNKNTQPTAAPTGFRYKADGVGVLENLPVVSSLKRTSIAWYETLGQFVQWLKE
jgi:uncharacterized SAM-binding protein YcdF (DUF218 family)